MCMPPSGRMHGDGGDKRVKTGKNRDMTGGFIDAMTIDDERVSEEERQEGGLGCSGSGWRELDGCLAGEGEGGEGRVCEAKL